MTGREKAVKRKSHGRTIHVLRTNGTEDGFETRRTFRGRKTVIQIREEKKDSLGHNVLAM